MKICVVGAGGVGGLLAAMLRRAAVDVSVLVTERHLEPIRRNGLTVIGPNGRFAVELQAEIDSRAIGACDVVIVTPKMWAVETLAPTLRPLLKANTAVIPLQNGIDAPATLANALGWDHVVYGSASLNAAIEEPGVIRQRNPNSTITVAEAHGVESARLLETKKVFGTADIAFEVATDGPALLWDKFVVLVSNSSLCALLRSPMHVVQAHDECWALYTAVFNEVVAVGRAVGISLPAEKVEARLARARSAMPMIMPSMAVDLIAGNRLEYPWLGGRIRQLGREHGVATPANDFISAALTPFLLGRTTAPAQG
ncbi:MAG TPA: 2-dehydropantoate 2-reductase [Burkholderiales bacterium]|nr:2-dehydropantoate 2-reductase [Burkholderiales bacterium]